MGSLVWRHEVDELLDHIIAQLPAWKRRSGPQDKEERTGWCEEEEEEAEGMIVRRRAKILGGEWWGFGDCPVGIGCWVSGVVRCGTSVDQRYWDQGSGGRGGFEHARGAPGALSHFFVMGSLLPSSPSPSPLLHRVT